VVGVRRSLPWARTGTGRITVLVVSKTNVKHDIQTYSVLLNLDIATDNKGTSCPGNGTEAQDQRRRGRESQDPPDFKYIGVA
jgi:hypothetical protein